MLTPCLALVKCSTDVSEAHSGGVFKLECDMSSDRELSTEARVSQGQRATDGGVGCKFGRTAFEENCLTFRPG